MNDEQRKAIIDAMEQIARASGAIRGQLSVVENMLTVLRDNGLGLLAEADGAKPERVLFCSPVTGSISATPNVYGLDWFDATGYAAYYTATGKPAYHTGADLNKPDFKDSGADVFAAADGEVVFSGVVPGWQGQVIIVKHMLEDGSNIWTRYAHVKDAIGIDDVKRGEKIAVIADYNQDGPKGDHLHFDVARVDLGAQPGDWPGLDKERLLRDYLDPAQFLKTRSK